MEIFHELIETDHGTYQSPWQSFNLLEGVPDNPTTTEADVRPVFSSVVAVFEPRLDVPPDPPVHAHAHVRSDCVRAVFVEEAVVVAPVVPLDATDDAVTNACGLATSGTTISVSLGL
jgi:hypothetical protein